MNCTVIEVKCETLLQCFLFPSTALCLETCVRLFGWCSSQSNVDRQLSELAIYVMKGVYVCLVGQG